MPRHFFDTRGRPQSGRRGAPCKRELPLLDRYCGLQKNAGLSVHAITTEGVPADLQAQAPVRGDEDTVSPFDPRALWPDRGIGAEQLRVIDRGGVLRYAKVAAFDLDDLNRILVPLLEQPA